MDKVLQVYKSNAIVETEFKLSKEILQIENKYPAIKDFKLRVLES